MSRSGRQEDRRLWEKVKATVTPLNPEKKDFAALLGKSDDTKSEPHQSPKTAGAIVRQQKIKVQPVHHPPVVRPVEQSIAKRIAKGRIAIDATIDLHGMTQVEAHQNLWRFVEYSHRSGRRTLLVITGKGSRGEGVLKRAVPSWLSGQEFRRFVSGCQEAHISHGGTGALYVRLKQNREDRMS